MVSHAQHALGKKMYDDGKGKGGKKK